MKNWIRLSVLVCGLAFVGSILGQTGSGDRPANTTDRVWQMIDVDCKQASLRGLHVLDAQHIFASGSKGIVVLSLIHI